MITDDPGTPAQGKWEINLGWTDQRTPGSTLYGLPQLDANYGATDRIELNYQASWNIARNAGQPTTGGMSDSEIAVKWRYYDAGEHGLQMSICPRVTFLDPGSDSARRGLADSDTNVLMPFEVQKDFPWLSVGVDGGYTFSNQEEDRGWMGGICVGREVAEGWEMDAEVHMTANEGASRSEWIANVGSRIDLSKHATVLLAVGRDISNTLGPRVSLLSYVGIQIRL